VSSSQSQKKLDQKIFCLGCSEHFVRPQNPALLKSSCSKNSKVVGKETDGDQKIASSGSLEEDDGLIKDLRGLIKFY